MLGLGIGCQNGIRKSDAVGLTEFAFIKPSRLCDLDIHRDYAEKGDELFKSNLFCAAFRSGEQLRNNDRRQDDPIRVVVDESNRFDLATKKINENIRVEKD